MRNRVVGVAAVVAVLLAAAGCAGTSTNPTGASVPVAVGSDTASAPVSGQPVVTGSSTVAPPTEPAGQNAAADAGTGGVKCPSAATLQAVAKLDTGYRVDASTIDCWKTWAVAGVKAPTVAQQGDGLVLFRHAAGKWGKVGDGSSFDCAADLGLAKGAKHPAWCTFA